jgi:hypothetical protein
MRYKIEYLTDPPDEHSVCHVRIAYAYTAPGARKEALQGAAEARELGAKGFQMRDFYNAGWIVSLESFDGGHHP